MKGLVLILILGLLFLVRSQDVVSSVSEAERSQAATTGSEEAQNETQDRFLDECETIIPNDRNECSSRRTDHGNFCCFVFDRKQGRPRCRSFDISEIVNGPDRIDIRECLRGGY